MQASSVHVSTATRRPRNKYPNVFFPVLVMQTNDHGFKALVSVQSVGMETKDVRFLDCTAVWARRLAGSQTTAQAGKMPISLFLCIILFILSHFLGKLP